MLDVGIYGFQIKWALLKLSMKRCNKRNSWHHSFIRIHSFSVLLQILNIGLHDILGVPFHTWKKSTRKLSHFVIVILVTLWFLLPTNHKNRKRSLYVRLHVAEIHANPSRATSRPLVCRMRQYRPPLWKTVWISIIALSSFPTVLHPNQGIDFLLYLNICTS